MPKKGYADVLGEPTDEKVEAMRERMKRAREVMLANREKKRKEGIPDPTKEVPLEEKIGTGRQKMDESDRSRIQREVQDDEMALLASADPEQKLRSQSIDVAGIKSRLERNKMILGHDEDLTARGGEKDRMARRLAEVTSILQKNMPTKREMWPKTGSVEAQQAVRHNVRFQENYGPLCHEYQELKKRLDPDDPCAQSLELIRPD